MSQRRATRALSAAILLAFAVLLLASCSAPNPPSPTSLPSPCPTLLSSPSPTRTSSPSPTPPASPAGTVSPSTLDADDMYFLCWEDVWDGYLYIFSLMSAASDAPDADMFCGTIDWDWARRAGDLRASHAECPTPAGPKLVTASDLLETALKEMEKAMGLYDQYCRVGDPTLADDAQQQLGQSLSHAAQAYEAVTGHPPHVREAAEANVAWLECSLEVAGDLRRLLEDFASTPDADTLAEFCAPVADWLRRLEEVQAKYALCETPTHDCLLTQQEPLEASLTEFGAGFQYYAKACAEEDESLLHEATRHMLDALDHCEEFDEALRQCSGDRSVFEGE